MNQTHRKQLNSTWIGKALIVILFIAQISYTSKVYAQNYPLGARQAALANTAVTISDIWSCFHNQAGLSSIKNPTIGVYYGRFFNIKELSNQGIAFATPFFKRGTVGINYSNFGFSEFKETKVGLAYSLSLSNTLEAAIQLDYFQQTMQAYYGEKKYFTGELGIRAKPIQNLTIGFHLFNPKFSKKNELEPELETVFKFGASYSFAENLWIAIETEKSLNFKPIYKAAIEYQFLKTIYIRTGISSNPSYYSFGLGTKYKKFSFDIAFSKQATLNLSSHFSIQYQF